MNRKGNDYFVFVLIEILYKKGLINEQTHLNVCNKYNKNSHN